VWKVKYCAPSLVLFRLGSLGNTVRANSHDLRLGENRGGIGSLRSPRFRLPQPPIDLVRSIPASVCSSSSLDRAGLPRIAGDAQRGQIPLIPLITALTHGHVMIDAF
jgi:hypothetical protein